MKRTFITFIMACILTLPVSLPAQSDWWKVLPPIVTSPLPNEWFDRSEGIMYCWGLADSVREEDVDHYEVQFANAPDYPINVYDPALGGGICDWNTARIFYDKCWYYDAGHQENHEPIYWRVRTVYTSGVRSNWGVSYHRVGAIDSVPDPLTITVPMITFHNCSPAVYHEWDDDPEAIEYEYGFAQTRPNILHLFDDCAYNPGSPITSNYFTGKHDCIHLPLYFLVRAVYDDGAGGTINSNWAITYYIMWGDCILCNVPISVEKSTWGAIKKLYD